MAKFYIATYLERHAEHNVIRDILVAAGHEITYDWTSHGSVKEVGEERLTEVAEAELKGVTEADFVVVLLPGGRGTHAEIGAAVAMGLPTYIHSTKPELFTTTDATCAFYWPSCVKRSQTPRLEDFAAEVVAWWASAPIYLGHRIPPELQPLIVLPHCDDCPVGHRTDPHKEDCPRAILCDWECSVQLLAHQED